MRKIYFTFAGIIFLAILIIAFGNLGIMVNGFMVFFEEHTGSMFYPIAFSATLGMLSGFFIGMGISTGGNKENQSLRFDEDDI